MLGTGGVSKAPRRYERLAARGGSRRNHHVDNIARDLRDVAVFHKMKENVFERSLADALANLFRGAASDNLSFPQDEQTRANLFNDFEDVRTIENGLAPRAEGLNEVFEDEGRSNVQAGERLIEDE